VLPAWHLPSNKRRRHPSSRGWDTFSVEYALIVSFKAHFWLNLFPEDFGSHVDADFLADK
jgi:hypothetical protein